MAADKKKKNRNELVGLQILEGVYFHYHHRRQLHSFRHHLLHRLTALCGGFLLLLAAVSFISQPTTHHLKTPFKEGAEESGMKFEKQDVFHIPMRGGGIGLDFRTWSNRSNLFYGCSNASDKFTTADINTKPGRFLLIETSGGLNQQRTGIIDAVVAAYILNATLIVPKLDQESFWNDSSEFSDVFDVDWFTTYLSKDVKIIKKHPEGFGDIATARVPRKCDPKCYLSRVLPIFRKKKAVRLTKFDYRLSTRLDEDLQKLRCRVNYHALRFNHLIIEMGKKLVERMRKKSERFVALHLRYEPDMLAFSGCYYGGGEKERNELGEIRKRWKTLPVKDPEREMRNGKCPLSPGEVGLMMRALGFGPETQMYVASGPIYGGQKALAPLRALFPNLHTKETLVGKQELSKFSSYSSRMAALDFIVSDESDVFVTNNNGNMAKILAGRRRYFGHKPTIHPNARKLNELFLNRKNMTWDEFSSRVRTTQIGFMGDPSETNLGTTGSYHEKPFSCICRNSEASSALQMSSTASSRRDQDLSEMEYSDTDE